MERIGKRSKFQKMGFIFIVAMFLLIGNNLFNKSIESQLEGNIILIALSPFITITILNLNLSKFHLGVLLSLLWIVLIIYSIVILMNFKLYYLP
jgi:hypothetical protein